LFQDFLYGIITGNNLSKAACIDHLSSPLKNYKFIDWNDVAQCVLFGDGAGACVLGKVKGNKGIIADHMHAQGQFGDLIDGCRRRTLPLDQVHKQMRVPAYRDAWQELF